MDFIIFIAPNHLDPRYHLENIFIVKRKDSKKHTSLLNVCLFEVFAVFLMLRVHTWDHNFYIG